MNISNFVILPENNKLRGIITLMEIFSKGILFTVSKWTHKIAYEILQALQIRLTTYIISD